MFFREKLTDIAFPESGDELFADTEFARIAEYGELLELPKNNLLFSAGERCQSVYFVQSGQVRLSIPVEDEDRSILLCLVGAGGAIAESLWELGGESFRVSGQFQSTGRAEKVRINVPLHTLSAETKEESSIFEVMIPDFMRMLRENPNFSWRLIRMLGRRLCRAEERIVDLSSLPVPARIAKMLLGLSGEYGRVTTRGVKLELKLTHQDIADYVGSSRVTVTQLVNKLKDNGMIGIESKMITIFDTDGLSELVCNKVDKL
jgi:CRP/FNR family transcriptional regulator